MAKIWIGDVDTITINYRNGTSKTITHEASKAKMIGGLYD